MRAVAGAMDKSLMAAHFAHLYRAVDNFWMNSAHYNAHKATYDTWMTAEILLCRQRTCERVLITAVDALSVAVSNGLGTSHTETTSSSKMP